MVHKCSRGRRQARVQEVVGYLFLVGSNIHPVDGCLAAELQSWNSHGEDDHASFYSDDNSCAPFL